MAKNGTPEIIIPLVDGFEIKWSPRPDIDMMEILRFAELTYIGSHSMRPKRWEDWEYLKRHLINVKLNERMG